MITQQIAGERTAELCPDCHEKRETESWGTATDGRCPQCGRLQWCHKRMVGNVLVLDVIPDRATQCEDMADLLPSLSGLDDIRCVVVNLSRVELVTSGFVAGLLGLWRRARKTEGRLVLYGLSPVVQDVLNHTRLTEIFTIRTSEKDALNACHSPC
jgi:anti-anti-sigma factor